MKKSKNQSLEKVISSLLSQGKARGFVTETEIMYALPNIEDNLEQLEEIYDALKEKAIKIHDEVEFLPLVTVDGIEDIESHIQLEKWEEELPDPVNMYLKEIGSIPLLSKDQEIYISKRVLEGDEDSKKELAEANLRLVVSIAKKYVGRSPNLTL